MRFARWRLALTTGVVALAGVGTFALTATGGKRADSPLIVVNEAIGGIFLGMPAADALALAGEPEATTPLVGADGSIGTIARYTKHGGWFEIQLVGGRVVSVETTSPYYTSPDGIGPAGATEAVAAEPGFRPDYCSLGYWTGTGEGDTPITIAFTRGDTIWNVQIAYPEYYVDCTTAGDASLPEDGGDGNNGPSGVPGGKKSGPPAAPPVAPAASDPLVVHVTVVPAGGGWVRSTPYLVDCPAACKGVFGPGASVALTPTPGPGYAFAGWADACAGAGGCTVSGNGPRSVTAIFTGSFVFSLKTPPAPPSSLPTGCTDCLTEVPVR